MANPCIKKIAIAVVAIAFFLIGSLICLFVFWYHKTNGETFCHGIWSLDDTTFALIDGGQFKIFSIGSDKTYKYLYEDNGAKLNYSPSLSMTNYKFKLALTNPDPIFNSDKLNLEIVPALGIMKMSKIDDVDRILFKENEMTYEYFKK